MTKAKLLLYAGVAGLLLTGWIQSQGNVPIQEAREAGARILRISTAGVGAGNYARVGYWLADSLMQVADNVSVWLEYRGNITGKGFRDGLLLLRDRKLEICLVNSHGVAAMALRGRGLFQEPVPLRAIAVIPEDDWCVFAVDANLGVRSFADLREKKVPLKLATGFLDGDSAVGFLALEVLRRHGIDPQALRTWGGEFFSGGPTPSRNDYVSGRANAVFQEAAFPELWKETARDRPTVFLTLEPRVAKEIEQEFGVVSVTVPANTYPGQDQPLLALDFSGFLICVREDMDESLAYRLAQIVVERRAELDRSSRFGSINVVPNLSLVSEPYAIDPLTVAKTPIPLHPGAMRYYKEKGLLN